MPDWIWPLLAALITGAVGGGIVSLIGQGIESSRGKKAWRRERQYQTYLDFLNATDQLNDMSNQKTKPTEDEFDVALNKAREITTALELLGPREVTLTGSGLWLAVYSAATYRVTKMRTSSAASSKREQVRLDWRRRFVEAAKVAIELK